MVIGQNVIDSHPGDIVKPMPVRGTGGRVAKSTTGLVEGVGESLPCLAIKLADSRCIEIADNELRVLRAMLVHVGSALERFVPPPLRVFVDECRAGAVANRSHGQWREPETSRCEMQVV